MPDISPVVLQNSKNPIHQMVYEYVDKRRDYVLVKNSQEASRRAVESNYAFIGESVSQDLMVARHCSLVKAPEVIGARGYGIATAKGEAESAMEFPPLLLFSSSQQELEVLISARALPQHNGNGTVTSIVQVLSE